MYSITNTVVVYSLCSIFIMNCDFNSLIETAFKNIKCVFYLKLVKKKNAAGECDRNEIASIGKV